MKKGKCDSFRYSDAKQIIRDQANSPLFPPKLGWPRYRSRDVLGTVKNITASLSCGKWTENLERLALSVTTLNDPQI
jgi:putative transposase